MTGLRAEVDLPGRLVAAVDVPPATVLAVIGPNGAGKTTLVESIAGTLLGGGSAVHLDDLDWTGLAPQQRSVGLVFQEHLLFPHLDARANVAFGLRARGATRRQARLEADHWLALLGVAGLAHRRPAALSGGQAQRVALARALATRPRVLLLDEPFSALDVGVAASLRGELAGHLRELGGVTVLVTHDALDVRALADRVLVLEAGRVVQDDLPEGVAEAPATAHAARLLGLNVLGVDEVVVPGHHPAGTLATFAPSTVTLTAEEPVGSARNRWRTTVRRAVERHGVVRVHLQAQPTSLYADVTPGAAAELAVEPGRVLWASVKATEVIVLGAGPTDR